jgi:hypothetical protein
MGAATTLRVRFRGTRASVVRVSAVGKGVPRLSAAGAWLETAGVTTNRQRGEEERPGIC